MIEKSYLRRIIDAGFFGVSIGLAWNKETLENYTDRFTIILLYKDGHQDLEGMVPIVSTDLEELMQRAAEHAEAVKKGRKDIPNLRKELDEMFKKLSPEQRAEILKGLV